MKNGFIYTPNGALKWPALWAMGKLTVALTDFRGESHFLVQDSDVSSGEEECACVYLEGGSVSMC